MVLEIAGGIILAVVLLWLGVVLAGLAMAIWRQLIIGAVVTCIWYFLWTRADSFNTKSALIGIAFLAPMFALAWWANRDQWAKRWKEWRDGPDS